MNSVDFTRRQNLYKLWSTMKKENICSQGSKFFPDKVDPFRKGDERKKGTFTSPEGVLTVLKR